jgi:hypothetical protein
MKIQYVSDLANKVANDPALAEQLKSNPADTLATLAAPLQSDRAIYRIVVASLGAAVVLAMVGAVVLTFVGKSVPDVLTALGSAAVGALAGLLAPSPVNR